MKKMIMLHDLIKNQNEIHNKELDEILDVLAFQLGGLLESVRDDRPIEIFIHKFLSGMYAGSNSFKQDMKGEETCH